MPVKPGTPTSYAVSWQESDGEKTSGKLLIAGDRLHLLARSGVDGRPVERSIAYAEVTGVRIGRSSGERLDGDPTIVLEHGSRVPLRIAPYGPGLLHELTDLLAQLSAEAADRLERIVLVAPPA